MKPIRYDWTPNAWAWVPEDGRLRAEHGRPNRPVDIEVSTTDLEPANAYEFWRETVFYTFEADRQPGGIKAGFQAHVRGLLASDMEFYHYRSDAISGHRTKRQANADRIDNIDIGLVLAGRRRQEFPDGTQHVAAPGELYFYDAAAASKVRWSEHRGLHLSLRRETVEAALGHRLPGAGEMAQMLGRNGMLARQLASFASLFGQLDAQDKTFLLNQTAQLAFYSIGRIGLELGKRARLPSSALLTAVQRHIESRLESPHLDVDEITAVLQCSRATLFRALANHGMTPAGLIQDMRIERALHLLQQATVPLTNEDLAIRCGFANVRSFLRAFKARSGSTPGQVREAIAAARVAQT